MNKFLRQATTKINANRFLAAFLVVVSVLVIGSTSLVSAAPDYFNVDKPGDPAICEGGEWKTVQRRNRGWRWGWWRRHQQRVWVPNWEKLGFESKGQCRRFVRTDQPESRRECREDWWQLGFNSRNDCLRYLRLHPGSGYDGNPQLDEGNPQTNPQT